MKLGDLQKKIYKRETQIDKRAMADDSYDSSKGKQAKDDFEKFESDVLQGQTVKNLDDVQKVAKGRKFAVVGVITVAIIVGIVAVIIGYFKLIGSAFVEEKVVISIEGAEEVKSAEDITYKITMRNDNRIDLKKVSLRLSYPENMIIKEEAFIHKTGLNNSQIDIGTIEAKNEKSVEISFKPFGPRDRTVFLNGSMLYQPNNFSSSFEKSTQKSIVIKSSPIKITIIPVKEAASGESVTVDVIIKNESSNSYENLELRMNYPEGFVFDSSEPESARERSIWSISSLEGKEQVKISIRGRLEGVEESLKRFEAALGELKGDSLLVYTNNEGIIKIVPSRVRLIIEPTVDALYAGEGLSYEVTFENTSNVPLRDLILYQYVTSPLLIKESTKADGGYYDNQKDVIFWKASDIPTLKNLQPGEKGSVRSSVQITSMVPMNNENDRNFTIDTYAEIESLDVDSPLWQNKRIKSELKQAKVHSKMILKISAAYNDGEIPNTGPVPLVVNEETTFTPRFSILNTSNDLKNVILKTSMPSGIVWKEKYLPENAGIEVNTRSNELKWIIGSIDAGVGFIEPVRTLAFQVGARPSVNQASAGSMFKLLNEIEISALDSFTGKEVRYTFSGLTLSGVNDIVADIITKEEAMAGE